ncbi:MAG: hypothetical protein LBU23_07020, partial [Planctomycetota bacterium]|nr:hypothetical protein [Planctomycetota bacterium]
MRIKCPYSDIYLDLPGDRTDMKFTCPACRRIHRVTISITTPGEDPPRAAANTRSMTRNPPPIPKKYATGAFAPVVDIPIDANFVLLDSRSVAQPGIDLGNAAEASVPGLDDGLAGRPAGPTVMGEEKKETPETPSSPDPAFQPEAPKTEKAAAGNPAAPTFRRAWDEVGEPVIPPTGAFPPAAATRLPDGGGLARRRGKTKSRAGRLALALILLGIGGFLGWQQYRQGQLRRDIGAGLERAESLWRLGDLPAAAAEARAANKTLLREETLPTIANLWNLLAERFAALPPFPDGRADIKARLNAHLERERALESFRERLDLSDPVGTAELLGEAAASERANGAAPMAAAMENLVARLTRQKLQSEAAGLAPEEAIRRADAEAAVLAPILPNPGRAGFGEAIDEFKAAQRLRFLDEAEREAAEIAAAAAAGDEAGLDRFLDLERRLADIGDGPELSRALPELADGDDRPALEQLARLARLVDQALTRARSALSRQENDEPDFEELLRQARTENSPHPAMAEAAGRRIEAARGEAGDLLDLRSGLFERMQAEMRRERRSPGTRLAWAMLRIGFADPEVEIDPAGFRHDSRQAAMRFRLRGLPVLMEMGEDDYENRVRAKV